MKSYPIIKIVLNYLKIILTTRVYSYKIYVIYKQNTIFSYLFDSNIKYQIQIDRVIKINISKETTDNQIDMSQEIEYISPKKNFTKLDNNILKDPNISIQ